jgi:type III restriction enzyme
MADLKIYQTQDLVLKVKENFNPAKLDLDAWTPFIDTLCDDREYQKEAIRTAVIYLAGGEYSFIEDLISENWQENDELRTRYKSISEYEKSIQLPQKLSGVIDLATGTGKSYVMYGIAQIALGLGLVDRVLVLCPSLTIESGLKEKFINLSGDPRIKSTLPSDGILNPRIIDANSTIKKGDIAIENIHAAYERAGSSIRDSFKGEGARVLVLNDEIHHAYNSSSDTDVRKWKSFLLSSDFNFKYILGFTGTAYKDDEYFNDVIYRFSIRSAIEERVVKSVEYVAKDESIDRNEKFQKIYDNHDEFVKKYRKIKPLTILVTSDISKARALREELIEFLEEREDISRSAVEKKILIVTSHPDHKKSLLQLKNVDDKDNSVEWIVSVSMLTEGWDVKNVFQIVPWEDRAFNSKLLIAQVLGRGLRVPEEYKSAQPKVRVFNHDAWSRHIKGLVDEILEVELKIFSLPLSTEERSKYHFDLYNIDFTKEEKEVKAKRDTVEFDYSKGYTKLISQIEEDDKETEYLDFRGNLNKKTTTIQKQTRTVSEVVDKIVEAFKTRDFEAQIRFPKGTYKKEHLPPEDEIRSYVKESMKRVGIKSGVLTEDNANRIYAAFQTLLRARGSTVVFERKVKIPIKKSTKELERESIMVGGVKQGATVFYTDEFEKENVLDQVEILKELISDESLPRSASKAINHYCFKTPVTVVLTKQEPERKFVENLVSPRIYEKVDAWIKSRDHNFYSIEYSITSSAGRHSKQAHFNPDFFLKIGNNIVVVEIKSDGDDSDENLAKYRWAKQHFSILNEELKNNKIGQKYFFHFLSPSNYSEFFEYLADGRLTKGEFRSSLEDQLEAKLS